MFFCDTASARRVKFASLITLIVSLSGIARYGSSLWAEPPSNVYWASYSLKNATPGGVAPQLKALMAGLPGAVELRIDRPRSQIVLSGTAEAHRLAKDLIAALDRPAETPNGNPIRAQLTAKSYSVDAERADEVTATLREKYGDRPEIRIVADPRISQIVVVATDPIHRELSQQFQRSSPGKKPSGKSNNIQPTWKRGPSQGNPSNPSHLRLNHISWRELEASLNDFLSGTLAVRESADGELATLTPPSRNGEEVRIRVDRPAGLISVQGPRRLSSAWYEVLQAFDTPRPTPDHTTKLVSLRNARPGDVQKAVSYLQTDSGQDESVSVVRPGSQKSARGLFALAQADAQPDPGAGAQGGTQAEPPPPGTSRIVIDPTAGGLIGQVQVEYIEGADLIVIRGHERDVARVKEIIDQIERLSAETAPEIRILPLLHVDSRSMEETVTTLYEEVFAPRQGQVSITSLSKPNALLLIGREESVNVIVDLVQRLDQPVAPETQFHVFQLQHISASDAANTIREFFDDAAAPSEETDRGRLGTKVRVTADVRSNALVVQASPRDIAEVTRLIKQIDVESSRLVNQVQIFQLRYARADELAPVLQGAISGQQGQTGGGGGQAARLPGQIGPTDPVQAGGAGQASTAAGRSAMLTFSTIDPKGQERLVTSGIISDVRVSADTTTNSLIVTGPEQAMNLIAALIQRLDQLPSAEAQIKVFSLENGDAASTRELLDELFQSQTGQQGGVGVSGPGESSLVPLRFSVDQRTNSIIASGSTNDLAVVRAIILSLDADNVRQRQNVVYRLRYALATSVETAIQNFLQAEQQRVLQQLQSFTQTAAQGAVAGPFEQIEREVVVVAEELTNTLIVSSTPRYYDEILRIIGEIDTLPPMVMIQVLIAEVQYSDQEEFGVELGIQDSILFDRGSVLGGPIFQTDLTGGNFVTNNPLSIMGAARNVGAQGITDLALGRSNSALGYGGLVLSAGSDSINVLLRALQQESTIRILSRPQIMTLDNRQAEIQVGQDVRIPSGTSVTQTGLTNIVTEPASIGLILQVTPQVSPDNTVTIGLLANKSALGAEEDGTAIAVTDTGDVVRSPIINVTRAQTWLTVRSGQTAVFSGLLTSNTQSFSRRVPIISEIPLLGDLFRFDGVRNSNTELLIILTPHVIRSADDVERINQIESARMHWCLADVVNMHGYPGMTDGLSQDSSIPTVYPDGTPPEAAPKAEKPSGSKHAMPMDGISSPQSATGMSPSVESHSPPLFEGSTFGTSRSPSAQRMPVEPATPYPVPARAERFDVVSPAAYQMSESQPVRLPSVRH